MGDVSVTGSTSSIPSDSRTGPRPPPISINQNAASAGTVASLADSGYASATQTPEAPDKNLKPSGVVTGGGTGRVLFPPSGSGELREFDKAVDKVTILRYKDVLERVEWPLLRFLTKRSLKCGTCGPMALRLMMLGQSEDTAKAWIVVLCHETRAKRARKFFEQQYVKDVIRPQDSSIPSFEVLVIGQSPKTRAAAIDVCIGHFDGSESLNATLCGAPMKLVKGDEYRFGTCGGLVKLTSYNGDYVLYGMTAGHLTDQVKGVCNPNLVAADDDSDSERCCFNYEDDHYDNDDDDDDDEELSEPNDPFDKREPLVLGPACSLDQPALLELPPPEPESWNNIGQIFCPPVTEFPQGPHCFDWALISIDDRHSCRPNVLGVVESNRKPRSGDFKVGTIDFMDSVSTRQVVMKSGFQGTQSGVMSSLPCRALLGHGTEFVDVYTLKLDYDAEIRDGDSGSWVLNASRLEVYGHVVASDVFGAGYVIPMTHSLEDMRETFDMASVELPTLVDVTCKIFTSDLELNVRDELPALVAPHLARSFPSTPETLEEEFLEEEQHGLLTSISPYRPPQAPPPPPPPPDSGYASHMCSSSSSPCARVPHDVGKDNPASQINQKSTTDHDLVSEAGIESDHDSEDERRIGVTKEEDHLARRDIEDDIAGRIGEMREVRRSDWTVGSRGGEGAGTGTGTRRTISTRKGPWLGPMGKLLNKSL